MGLKPRAYEVNHRLLFSNTGFLDMFTKPRVSLKTGGTYRDQTFKCSSFTFHVGFMFVCSVLFRLCILQALE